jgi:DNA-binding beta-propeller fold protein YncE
MSPDGRTMLMVALTGFAEYTLYEISLSDPSRRRVVGAEGSAPLEFFAPQQVWIAPDGFVFVAEINNNRVQVLTPRLDFCCFVGVGELASPSAVCANADFVVVTEEGMCCLTVFRRYGDDFTFLRRFGRGGDGDGQLRCPLALCFMSGDSRVAVADSSSDRVSVFSLRGHFIRHVGVGVLKNPWSVACSAFDELVVADAGNRCLRVFSSTSDLVATVGACTVTSVFVHGDRVLAAHGDVNSLSGSVSMFS